MKGKEVKSAPKTYLVEVVLVSKSPLAGSLSYFAGERIPAGTLVNVPLKNRLCPAVVISSKDVRSAKADIRRAGFLLKKIRNSDILDARLEPHVFRALEDCARYYATPLGVLLAALLPKLIGNDPAFFLGGAPENRKKNDELPQETFLLQMEGEERYGQYRALVRQNFAKGKSVMFIVPTHIDVVRAASELEKGISEFVHLFSLDKKESEAKATWKKAREEKHPIVFITTPAGLFFSRPDLETMIVERANSRAYRTIARPHVDLRVLIEFLADQSGKHLVLGDSVLPIETLWREKSGYRKNRRGVSELSLIRWRLPAASARIIDAAAKQNETGGFEIFTPELKALIQKAIDEKERVFLFGARKGLAPTTTCGDCGTLLPCLNCGAPVVLHRRNEANIYICHACGSTREASTLCGHCNSWRLVPLGIGTEEIARQAHLLFPGVPVDILDKEHAPTDRKAAAIAKSFKNTGGILVGTELAFYHLDPVPYSGLVSVDALFSIPDFYINERVFYLVSRLRELTKNEVVVQTRNIGRQILAWATYGNITDFYQNEIDEREALLYPPFSIFIKVTAPKQTSIEGLNRLREMFMAWHPDVLRDSIVMRIPRDAWPDAELSQKLSLLGPEFSIKVDPESIL